MPVGIQLVSYHYYSNGRFPMSLIDNAPQNSWFFSGKFLDHLEPHIILIHGNPMEAEHKLILRFQNGFGVEILQSFCCRERTPLFKVLVLQFIGPRLKDFKTLEYFSIPTINWGNEYEKVIFLCQRVAHLPSRAAA
jgi:hypothetical protein